MSAESSSNEGDLPSNSSHQPEHQPFNHDIFISNEYASLFPLISPLLMHEALKREMLIEDEIAKRYKRRFVLFGAWSVALSLIPLLALPFTVGLSGGTVKQLVVITAIDSAAIFALLLVVVTRIGKFRENWRIQAFVRERMRQWHFQLFLDGPFIETAANDPETFRVELDRRWSEFIERTSRARYIAFREFVDEQSFGNDIYFAPKPYTDQRTANEVWRVVLNLRITHQIGFAGIQNDPGGGVRLIPTPEKYRFLESVAVGSLLAAVVFTLTLFGIDLLEVSARSLGKDFGRVSNVAFYIARAAMFFTALSAGARALKSGFTLPEEVESYDEYRGKLLQLKRQFMTQEDDAIRLRILHEVEIEAARELRRFMKMKGRATFLV